MPYQEYHKPASIPAVMELLRRPSMRTCVLAGGAWLNGEGSLGITAVVDISSLGLNQIERLSSPSVLRIGATCSLESLYQQLRSDPSLDVLSTTAAATASLNIRNQATIGGSIVTADAASPLITALLACDAELLIEADKQRNVTLGAFLSYRERILTDPVLITHVIVPIPSPDTHAAYARVARTPKDYPIVCAVAQCAVKNGVAGNIRIAVGGVAAYPIRLADLEFALEKKHITLNLPAALSSAVRNLSPSSDWLGSADYRREMASTLTRRVILEAAGISQF